MHEFGRFGLGDFCKMHASEIYAIYASSAVGLPMAHYINQYAISKLTSAANKLRDGKPIERCEAMKSNMSDRCHNSASDFINGMWVCGTHKKSTTFTSANAAVRENQKLRMAVDLYLSPTGGSQ